MPRTTEELHKAAEKLEREVDKHLLIAGAITPDPERDMAGESLLDDAMELIAELSATLRESEARLDKDAGRAYVNIKR